LNPRSPPQKISTHATEGMQMRAIMQAFDRCKRRFVKNAPEMMYIDLPGPLDHLEIPGKVKEGELTITWYVLSMF